MTFRFDDVCINADMGLIQKMTDYLFQTFRGCEVIWGISPLVHNIASSNPAKKQPYSTFKEDYIPLIDYINKNYGSTDQNKTAAIMTG